MNSLFEETNKEYKISTYSVIPMTKILGVLQWVDYTKVLKEILEKEYQETDPNKDLIERNPAFQERRNFLN